MPEQAAVVQRIFSDFLAGKTINAIQRELNRQGTPSKTGGKWHHGTISRILRNPVYRGKVQFEGDFFEGQHEKLIEPETFQRVQALLERNTGPSRGAGRPPKEEGIFARKGFLKCGSCGGSMIARKGRYLCYTRVQDGPEACEQPSLERGAVDRAVFAFFERVALDKDATRREIERNLARRRRDASDARKRAEKELENAERRLARVRKDYQDGELTAAEWREQSTELEAERVAAREAMSEFVEDEQSLPDTALDDAEEAVMAGLARLHDAIAAGGTPPVYGLPSNSFTRPSWSRLPRVRRRPTLCSKRARITCKPRASSFTPYPARMPLSTPGLSGVPWPNGCSAAGGSDLSGGLGSLLSLR